MGRNYQRKILWIRHSLDSSVKRVLLNRSKPSISIFPKTAHDQIAYWLDEIGRHFSNVRNIYFGINLFCGCIFIIVLKIFLGWQEIRPAASEAVFVEHLARLAVASATDSSKSELEQQFVRLAQRYYKSIVTTEVGKANKTEARDTLQGHFDILTTSMRERYIDAFVREFRVLDSSNRCPGQQEVHDIQVWRSMQEIQDRQMLNSETRISTIEPRMYTVPLIGVQIQREDINIPLTLILLVLGLFVSREVKKGTEALNNIRSLELTSGLSKNEKEFLRKAVRSKSHYVSDPHLHSEKWPLPDQSLFYLLMFSFFVVTMGAFANLYDNTFLDIRLHNLQEFFEVSTVHALWFIFLLSMSGAAYLAYLTYDNATNLHRTMTSGEQSKEDTQEKFTSLFWRACTFPFLIVEGFFTASLWGNSLQHRYFPSPASLGVLLIWYSLAIFSIAKPPKAPKRSMKRLCLQLISRLKYVLTVSGIAKLQKRFKRPNGHVGRSFFHRLRFLLCSEMFVLIFFPSCAILCNFADSVLHPAKGNTVMGYAAIGKAICARFWDYPGRALSATLVLHLFILAAYLFNRKRLRMQRSRLQMS